MAEKSTRSAWKSDEDIGKMNSLRNRSGVVTNKNMQDYMQTSEKRESRVFTSLDKTMSVLNSAVGKLGLVASKLSSPARAVGRTVASELNFDKSRALATGLGRINPILGYMAEKVIENNKDSIRESISNSADRTRELFGQGFAKMKMGLSGSFSRNNIANVPSAPQQKPIVKSKRNHRLQLTSYTKSYGSTDMTEAIDLLRMSNAEWLKAIGTESKSDIEKKPLPKAKSGGYVHESGKAIVHKGELITPAKYVSAQVKILSDIYNILDRGILKIRDVDKHAQERNAKLLRGGKQILGNEYNKDASNTHINMATNPTLAEMKTSNKHMLDMLSKISRSGDAGTKLKNIQDMNPLRRVGAFIKDPFSEGKNQTLMGKAVASLARLENHFGSAPSTTGIAGGIGFFKRMSLTMNKVFSNIPFLHSMKIYMGQLMAANKVIFKWTFGIFARPFGGTKSGIKGSNPLERTSNGVEVMVLEQKDTKMKIMDMLSKLSKSFGLGGKGVDAASAKGISENKSILGRLLGGAGAVGNFDLIGGWGSLFGRKKTAEEKSPIVDIADSTKDSVVWLQRIWSQLKNGISGSARRKSRTSYSSKMEPGKSGIDAFLENTEHKLGNLSDKTIDYGTKVLVGTIKTSVLWFRNPMKMMDKKLGKLGLSIQDGWDKFDEFKLKTRSFFITTGNSIGDWYRKWLRNDKENKGMWAWIKMIAMSFWGFLKNPSKLLRGLADIFGKTFKGIWNILKNPKQLITFLKSSITKILAPIGRFIQKIPFLGKGLGKVATTIGNMFLHPVKTFRAGVSALGNVMASITSVAGNLMKSGSKLGIKGFVKMLDPRLWLKGLQSTMKGVSGIAKFIQIIGGKVVPVAINIGKLFGKISPLTMFFALYDAISGWFKAGTILGMKEEDVQIKDRAAVAMSGLISGLTTDVLQLLAKGIKIGTNWVAKKFFGAKGNVFEDGGWLDKFIDFDFRKWFAVEIFQPLFTRGSRLFSSVLDIFVDGEDKGFWGRSKEILASVWDAVWSLTKWLVKPFTSIGESLGPKVGDMIGNYIVSPLMNLWMTIGEWISDIPSKVKLFIADHLPSKVANFLLGEDEIKKARSRMGVRSAQSKADDAAAKGTVKASTPYGLTEKGSNVYQNFSDIKDEKGRTDAFKKYNKQLMSNKYVIDSETGKKVTDQKVLNEVASRTRFGKLFESLDKSTAISDRDKETLKRGSRFIQYDTDVALKYLMDTDLGKSGKLDPILTKLSKKYSSVGYQYVADAYEEVLKLVTVQSKLSGLYNKDGKGSLAARENLVIDSSPSPDKAQVTSSKTVSDVSASSNISPVAKKVEMSVPQLVQPKYQKITPSKTGVYNPADFSQFDKTDAEKKERELAVKHPDKFQGIYLRVQNRDRTILRKTDPALAEKLFPGPKGGKVFDPDDYDYAPSSDAAAITKTASSVISPTPHASNQGTSAVAKTVANITTSSAGYDFSAGAQYDKTDSEKRERELAKQFSSGDKGSGMAYTRRSNAYKMVMARDKARMVQSSQAKDAAIATQNSDISKISMSSINKNVVTNPAQNPSVFNQNETKPNVTSISDSKTSNSSVVNNNYQNEVPFIRNFQDVVYGL